MSDSVHVPDGHGAGGPGGAIFFIVIAGLCGIGAVRLALDGTQQWPWTVGLLAAAAALGTVGIWALMNRA